MRKRGQRAPLLADAAGCWAMRTEPEVVAGKIASSEPYLVDQIGSCRACGWDQAPGLVLNPKHMITKPRAGRAGGWNQTPRLIPKAKVVPFEWATALHPGEDRVRTLNPANI